MEIEWKSKGNRRVQREKKCPAKLDRRPKQNGSSRRSGRNGKRDGGRGKLSWKKREKNVLLLLEMHDDETRPDRDAKRKETEKGKTQLSPRTDAACFSILS